MTTSEMIAICVAFGSRFDRLKKLLERGVIGGRSARYKLIDVAYTECPELHDTPEYKQLIGVARMTKEQAFKNIKDAHNITLTMGNN